MSSLRNCVFFAAAFALLPLTPPAASGQEPGAFRVNVTYGSMKPWVKDLVQRALPLVERAVSSNEFGQAVLDYRSKSGAPGFEWNDGLSNAEVLAKIRAGVELAYEGLPGEMDITLSDYWRPSSAVAKTSPNSNLIQLNRYKYKNMDEADVANNLVHEWLHKIGFDHSYEWTPERDDTVPYAIGNLVEKLVRQSL